MTRLGTSLSKKSINKVEVLIRKEITTYRLRELTFNSSTKRRTEEFLIDIYINSCEILEAVCYHLTLQN